jgi:hypothetical protein
MAIEVVQTAGLLFFADEQDARLILDRLNVDPDIAFIIHDGPRSYETAQPSSEVGITAQIGTGHPEHRQRWRAVWDLEQFEENTAGDHILWHVPSGPLPLIRAGQTERMISDPWAGWIEEEPNQWQDAPYFGWRFYGTIQLQLNARHLAYTETELKTLRVLNHYWMQNDGLYVSHFQSKLSSAEAEQWWARFEGWVSSTAVKLKDQTGGNEVWTFPSALQRLKAGLRYWVGGNNLEDSIQQARVRSSS